MFKRKEEEEEEEPEDNRWKLIENELRKKLRPVNVVRDSGYSDPDSLQSTSESSLALYSRLSGHLLMKTSYRTPRIRIMSSSFPTFYRFSSFYPTTGGGNFPYSSYSHPQYLLTPNYHPP